MSEVQQYEMNPAIALAFAKRFLKATPVVIHMEAHLGDDRIPCREDFDSDASEAYERCDEFVGYLEQITACLRGHLDGKGVQKEFDLKPESESA